MKYDKKSLIKYRISRATETLEEAKLALDHNKLNLAANRIYYSGFYIVSALALKNDFSTSKHSQLMSWFNKNYIKNGLLARELGKIYLDAFEMRQESDYEDLVNFERENLEFKLEQMKYFFDSINSLVEKN